MMIAGLLSSNLVFISCEEKEQDSPSVELALFYYIES